jgi:hypothetical protein
MRNPVATIKTPTRYCSTILPSQIVTRALYWVGIKFFYLIDVEIQSIFFHIITNVTAIYGVGIVSTTAINQLLRNELRKHETR